MSKDPIFTYENRELSWLSFNERVLQEAQDPSVPLFERLFFLGVFSSNLDEFYRVRVASLRSLLRLGKKSAGKIKFNPRHLLAQISHTVVALQEEFGRTFSGILQEMETLGVAVVVQDAVSHEQKEWLQSSFDKEIRSHVSHSLLDAGGDTLFLKDRGLYLVVELWPKKGSGATRDEPEYALVEIPSPPLSRFIKVPEADKKPPTILFMDDVIRLNLPRLFGDKKVGDSFSVKISRDAELYIDEDHLTDEFARGLAKLIKKSLSKRETGLPCRFLYDKQTPLELLEHLKNRLDLDSADLVLGGRYHNLNDLMAFPRLGSLQMSNEPMPPLPHPELEQAGSLFEAISGADRLLHVPYQRFDYVIRFLEEAASDPTVESVSITLYRVAKHSAVVDALVRAAEAGKMVTAFVEAKARFDEARNLESAEKMETAGVRVLYSMPKLKVHAKIALVVRRENGTKRHYAYLGTGNFNERTALVYADVGLFTADARVTTEVERVFDMLVALASGEQVAPLFDHLLVAPHAMREKFYDLIDAEAERARAGYDAWMILKMNSLEDPKIIRRLYEASQAGVRIRILVRGICCLVPGVEGQSKNIEVTSILDRFLEHARMYAFSNAGEPVLYLASADWMRRNLSHRVEVGFPIYDKQLRSELFELLNIQAHDNRKARIIDREQRNAYVPSGDGPAVRTQVATYEFFGRKR